MEVCTNVYICFMNCILTKSQANIWTNTRDRTNVMRQVVRSCKASHTQVDFYDINVKFTKCTVVPKKHCSALNRIANVTQVLDSREKKICPSTFVEFIEDKPLCLKAPYHELTQTWIQLLTNSNKLQRLSCKPKKLKILVHWQMLQTRES